MKSMMRRTTFREIKHSLGRYLAILAIVTLGVGFFAGLRITKPSMLMTAQDFLTTHSFYDYRLVSTLGFEEEDVASIVALEGVKTADGAITQDFLSENRKGEKKVFVALSITEGVNTLELSDGRMPEKADECVIDARYEGLAIGDTVNVEEDNEENTVNLFRYAKYTIVGKVKSPLYVNFERGTTALSDGSVSGFVYMQKDGFDADFDTDIYLTYDTDAMIYSKEYEDFVAEKRAEVKKAAEACLERRYEAIVTEAQKEIDEAKEEISDNDKKLLDGEKELLDGEQKLSDASKELDEANAQLATAGRQLSDGQTSLESGETQLAESQTQLDALKAMGQDVTAQQQQLDAAAEQLAGQKSVLTAAKKEMEQNRQTYEEALENYQKNAAVIEEKKTEISEAKAELLDAKQKVADAQEKLNDKIKELSDRKVYVLGRDTNTGYLSFQNDSAIVEGIANVFPIFFFLVAALVCMTTMTRMVEEQRTQIGVLKALGYSSITIMNKYLFYSTSAAVIGGVVGFFGGCYLFPMVIWQAYGIMYDFSGTIDFLFDPALAGILLLISLLCTGGATFLSCYYELNGVPADLIRPKAPKNGKRIVLERITFLWKHLKFMQKVSIRNTFRYKKRFFMMLLGISGCTALLVTGFGINDSISNIVSMQYEEIETYDASVNFDTSFDEKEAEMYAADTDKLLSGTCFLNSSDVEVKKDKVTKSVTMIVPKTPEEFLSYVNLHTSSGETIEFPKQGTVVLTDKTAEKLGVAQGDTITLLDEDLNEAEVTVAAVTENYIYHYVYMSPETYEQLTGSKPEYKTAYVCFREGLSDEEVSRKLLNVEHIASISGNSIMVERFGKMIESLYYIVLLIIVCAGALAFIVLYNLTNINITERVREIATIKVLGFFPGEVNTYVLRENLVLTAIGAIAGLLLGRALHAFVMMQIDINLVHFPVLVYPVSYLYSLILTFGFAVLVNLFMGRKLEKIDMAESMKAIE